MIAILSMVDFTGMDLVEVYQRANNELRRQVTAKEEQAARANADLRRQISVMEEQMKTLQVIYLRLDFFFFFF